MKRNIFKLFLNKFLAYPLWVKQVVFYRLWQNMQEQNCDRFVINHPDKNFAMHIPTLTFRGKQELWDKKGGLDGNIYNFLKFSHDGYNILEIALNMFMSMEEVSKLYIFCYEQKLIELPEQIEVHAMAEFISGKITTGEYFLKIGSIEQDQLDYALAEQHKTDDKNDHLLIGKIFVNLGYLTEATIKTVFKLKTDAKKRFVINPENLPDNKDDTKSIDKYKEEIQKLKDENKALKKAMTKIVNAVKTYDF